jgi:subtilase family serine protease
VFGILIANEWLEASSEGPSMNQICARSVCALPALALALGFATTASATQNHESLIRDSINDANRITLAGNTHPDAIPANDRGILRDETPMNGLQLVLHRSPEAEVAFEQYISELHNPKSAFFHKWLTNKQIGDRFGASDEDIDTVKEWLSSKGLHVSNVSPDRMTIEFSGDAGHVRNAFQAPLHNLMVDGKAHISNMNDPTMPRALASVVSGVAKLNDFMPHGLNIRRPDVQPKTPQGSAGYPYNFIGAADLATIYNFNPLFTAGITGKGQTVVVIEDTPQYSAGDFLVFRKNMGLSRTYPYGTLIQVSPTGKADTCTPTVANDGENNGDDAEAAIDADWATSAAPNATIMNASCLDTTQFGGFLALANLLTETNPPTVVSISYGESETELGAAENLYINNLYQSAVTEGVTVFVSSGDEGADSTDANSRNATHGISVSGFTSTPYNVSVGGTDFAAYPFGEYNTYFSTTDLANFRTALSYVPEIPWDDSCAGGILAYGFGLPTYGTDSVCNVYGKADGLLTTAAGSGGPSGCATGAATTGGVVSGTCAGYTKPAWQSLVGVPADGVRDIPDVSLMASNGFWGVYYAACISDPQFGFGACGANPADWAGYGGTSVSSPIWAGIQALVNQSTGESWGNSNYILYGLANAEYGASGNSSCNSSLGNGVGPTCMFYDVTQGDNVINCTGTNDCYNGGGKYGILSTSDTSPPDPAYTANIGWDFPTGIGTANATNLVNGWHVIAATTKPVRMDQTKK